MLVRECEPHDEPGLRRIFTEGMMEMTTDTAFRGLPHHPDRLLLYGALTGQDLSEKISAKEAYFVSLFL